MATTMLKERMADLERRELDRSCVAALFAVRNDRENAAVCLEGRKAR
jgi:hypothetical protein